MFYPDGRSVEEPDDYFVNTDTGEIIHDPNLGKSDAKKLGDNYEHVAYEHEITNEQRYSVGLGQIMNSDNLTSPRRKLNLVKSVELMSLIGEKLVPRKTITDIGMNGTVAHGMPQASTTVVTRQGDEVWLDLTYVPKNFIGDKTSYIARKYKGDNGLFRYIRVNNYKYDRPDFATKMMLKLTPLVNLMNYFDTHRSENIGQVKTYLLSQYHGSTLKEILKKER